MNWYVGCSGFHYKEWKDGFYPENLAQKKWFEYYCDHFTTLELNVTFYRFPQLHFLKSWYDKSPSNFTFAVKAPRLITHYKQLHDSDSILKDFYSICDSGLKNKLGCFLFQFPKQYLFTDKRLETLIQSLDTSFRNVVEFRHESWWGRGVIQELGKNNIAFCGISHPMLPAEAIVNTSLAYYRFHGVPDLYKSLYSEDELNRIFNDLAQNKNISEAYIFFNNTANLSAINNAAYMKTLAEI